MLRNSSVIILMLIIISISYSKDKSLYYSFENKYNVEKLVIPHNNPDSITVKLLFKIPNAAILFKRVQGKNNFYSAQPEMELIVKDEEGITRFRKLWKKTIEVNSFEKTKLRSQFIEAFLSFNLENKSHSLKVVFMDRKSRDKNKIKLSIDGFDYDANSNNFIKDLFFAGKSGDFYHPYILNSNSYFDPNGFYIFLPLIKKVNGNIEYSLTRVKGEDNHEHESLDDESQDDDNHHGNKKKEKVSDIFQNYNLGININGKVKVINSNLDFNTLNNKVRFEEIANSENKFLKIFIEPKNIFPGTYKLKLEDSGGEISQEYKFKIIWDDKPVSLKDIDYAISKMHFILTNDEYEKMLEGSEEEMKTKFVEYWEKKDPTPKTPFNEALNQYFSRVDYSFFNFKTSVQKDGSKTDRGKIYILYGPPTSIKSMTKSGKSQYEWTYKRLDKVFTFEIISNGIIRLIAIKDK